MISKGQKQEAGLANLRKKRKGMDKYWLKTGLGQANLRKREENKWISWAKNRGQDG